ncbi:MAG: S-layer homology domain-containing protein [Oscillospiraceae bacterium]
MTNKTGEHTIIVENGATLTITGNGIVDNVSHGKAAVYNEGTVTLAGGTFKRSVEKGTYSPYSGNGNSWYTIANYGTMEINTGVTVKNAGGYSSMICNGSDRVTANCYLTIKGGNFTGGVNTVKNDSFGVLTINGGNFSNTAQYVIMNWNKAEITAGTFQTLDTASAVLFTSAYGGDANTVGKLTISGGEFKHASDTQEMIVDHYDASNSGTAAVTGGKFDADISKYIPTDYVQSADGTVEKLGETNAVAKVGDTYYKTLADAVAAADNNTVTLLKDVTADITIPAGKTMTLDLNGKTLTNVNDHTILNNGNLTITGTGKVDNISHAKGALYNKGTVVVNGGTFDRSKENGKTSNDSGSNSWYTIKNVGSMTIHDGATVQTAGNNTTLGKFSSLVSNGYFNAGDYTNNRGLEQPILTIDGGTFRGGLNTIKNDDHAKLTINGGTFSNYYQAVVQNHNIAEITGGTFTAASDANAKTYGIYNCGCGAEIDLGTLTVSGGTFTGATYAVADVSSENADVTISGGQFAGTKAAIVKSSTSKATIAVSGGKFSSDPSVYVVGNGNTNIVKRDGSEGAYTYTVLAKSGLTSGVYLTNPSGALASNYYVSSTANGVWTVSYSAPYSGGSSSYDPTYSVSTPSKTEHGTVTVSPKNASKGDRVTVTVKPDSGYVLETLTVTDKNGNELTLKDKGNGKYTFTMPAGKVEVKATFMEDNSMLNFFYDVPNNAYFYEAVKWAVKNGITTGVGNNLFAPEQPCTRAQIVTFLWRAAGSPEPKGAASGMTDVVSGSYYEKAVAWAIENGITTGTTTTTFSPDATCTRAQAVTFLARALKAKAASAAEFSDVPTGSYFADAVAWAAANGVTEGIGGGLFGSDNDCTRGQIVTFLYRAYNK